MDGVGAGRSIARDPVGDYSIKASLPPLTPSNRFRTAPPDPRDSRTLELGVSASSGVMSLIGGFAEQDLGGAPVWLTYAEPEGHIQSLAAELLTSGSVAPGARVKGVSDKDRSLVAALAAGGCALDEPILFPGMPPIEVQRSVSSGPTCSDRPDVLVARHILEHARELPSFLSGLADVARPGGLAIFEVPDCESQLREGDASILWEEHVHYFTSSSVEIALRQHAWIPVRMWRLRADGEDVALMVARHSESSASVLTMNAATRGIEHSFVRSLNDRFADVTRELRRRHELGASIVLVGANHVGINLIDMCGREGLISAVVDDHPRKQGCRVSRFGTPVIPLSDTGTTPSPIFILAVNPTRAGQIVERLKARCGDEAEIVAVSELYKTSGRALCRSPRQRTRGQK